ncbi:MAG: hypothetical protein QM487_08820 [Candidatus Marithrix sp.]
MKTLISIFFLVFLFSNVFADDEIVVEWEKKFDNGDYTTIPKTIVQTNDGGFAITARTYKQDESVYPYRYDNDTWVIKLDSNGNKQWDIIFGKNLDLDSQASFNSIVQTSDDGFTIVGMKEKVILVVRLDKNGNRLWEKNIPEYSTEYDGIPVNVNSITQIPDNKIVVVGTFFSKVNRNDINLIFIKLDNNGNKLLEKVFYSNDSYNINYNRAIIQTIDSGFILLNGIFMKNSGFQNAFGDNILTINSLIIKLDNNGNQQWNKIIGGNYWDETYSIIQTTDKGFAIVGDTNIGKYNVLHNTDAWILKLDMDANQQWEKIFGSLENFYNPIGNAYSIIQTSDGEFLIAGQMDHQGSQDLWLIKLNKDGTLKWENFFGEKYPSAEYANSIIQTSDGGFAVVGHVNNEHNKGIWLIKFKNSDYINPIGNLIPNIRIEPTTLRFSQ